MWIVSKPTTTAAGRIPRRHLLPWALTFMLCLAGCGEKPRLITTLPEDPRGGSAIEITAAALYASGLQHAWNQELGRALTDLHQADHLAPGQPLILAALGFTLDDLAHPEEMAPPGSPATAPANAPIHHGELPAEALLYLNRAADLKIDDARVYERLAAHWYRLSKRPPGPDTGAGDPAASDPASTVRFNKEAERQSAYFSLQALKYLAADPASDLARQKAMVYISHLGKYYRQQGLLAEELTVVRIHRSLDPADVGLQLDEIELLYLTRQIAAAENRLSMVQAENIRTTPLGTSPALIPNATNPLSPLLPNATGSIQRRLQWTRALGRRVQAALRTDSQWPHNVGDPAATPRSAPLRWINEFDAGTADLWNAFWQDFNAAPPANPITP